jgi:hypothetical protein
MIKEYEDPRSCYQTRDSVPLNLVTAVSPVWSQQEPFPLDQA